MIVAIAKAGAGVTRIEELREAVDVSAAIAAFVGEYSPPLSAADYTGVDAASRPALGGGDVYYLNRDTSVLTAGPATRAEGGAKEVLLQSPDGSVWSVTITDAGMVAARKV